MRWVTEARPHVDRCASAWFIRRFVDPQPRFLFIQRGERIPRGAIPYDLRGSTLGHKGSKVTFDAFLSRYRRNDAGLRALADVVRDIDLAIFRRHESKGLEAILTGILLALPDDLEVYRATYPVFEGLYRRFLARPARKR